MCRAGTGWRVHAGALASFPESSKCGSELDREELRLLPSGEVTALVDLVPVDQIVKGLLRPASGCSVDLAWKDRYGDRDFLDLDRVEGTASALRRVPVGP